MKESRIELGKLHEIMKSQLDKAIFGRMTIFNWNSCNDKDKDCLRLTGDMAVRLDFGDGEQIIGVDFDLQKATCMHNGKFYNHVKLSYQIDNHVIEHNMNWTGQETKDATYGINANVSKVIFGRLWNALEQMQLAAKFDKFI